MALPAAALQTTRLVRSRKTPQDDQDGLLKSLSKRTLSGLSMVGNVLDLPGSSVRDLLAGENPFDQYLSPISGENRVSGRELMERSGFLGKNQKGFDLGDVAGFAGEVLLDPLTYASFGGSALGKAGQVIKKAGGIPPGMSRVARMTTDAATQASRTAPEALEHAARASGYADAGSLVRQLGSEKIGGLIGVGLPFRPPSFVVGTGPLAQKVGGALDVLGQKVRYSPPGRQAARIFSARAKGLHTKEIAPFGEALYDEGELVRRGVRAETAKQFTKMANAGELSDEASVIGRLYGENQKQIDPYLSSLTPKLQQQIKVMAEVMAPFKKAGDAEFAKAQFLGTKLEHFADPAGIDFVHREFLNKIHNLAVRNHRENYLRGIQLGTENLRRLISDPKILEGSPDDAFQYVMQEWAPKFVERTGEEHLFRELTDQIRNVYTPEQRAAGGFGSHVLHDQQEGLLGAKLNNAKTEAVIKSAAKFAKPRLATDIPGEKMTLWEVMNEAGLNAGVERAPHEVVGQPIRVDLETPRLEKAARAGEGSDFYDTASRVETTSGPRQPSLIEGTEAQTVPRPPEPMPVRGPGDMTLRQEQGVPTHAPFREVEGKVVGGAAGARKPTARNGAIYRIADELAAMHGLKFKETPEYLQTIGHLVVPKELGDDIVRLAKGDDIKHMAGPLLRAFDSATNLFKVGVLNWPARYVRDRTSGLAMNMLTGNFSPTASAGMHALVAGNVVDFTHIPAIQKMLADQGLEATAENSTEMMRQLFYTYEKHTAISGHLGTSEITGDLSGMLPSGVKEFAAEFPGRDPVNPLRPRTLNAGAPVNTLAAWNPINIRGFGGRTKTGLKPAAVGERIGRYTDSMNRGEAFIANLERGVAPEQASKIADALQVNYQPRSFTAAEREYLKRLFPFYGFASRMLPEVTRQLLNRPGGGIAQSIRAANDLRGESEGPIPDYIGKGLAIPLGETPTGDQQYLTALDLMHEAPLNILQSQGGAPDLAGTLRNIGAMGNPFLKGTAELAFGKTLFQNRELEEADPTIGRLLTNVGLRDQPVSGRARPFIGTGFEQLAANSPLSRVLSSARVLTDPRKGIGAKAANLLTGAKISDISPAAQDAVLRDALQDLSRETGATSFESVRFTKAQIEAAEKESPELAERMRELNAAATELANRSKARKKVRKPQR